MNIGIVTYALHVGGVETFIKLLAKHCIEKGHRVEIIETRMQGTQSTAFQKEGYSVVRVLPKQLHSRTHHCHRIAQQLQQYDAVIVNNDPITQASLGLLNTTTIAISVLHQSYILDMVRTAVGNKNNIHTVACVSPAAKEKALACGADVQRTVYIPNGVDVSRSHRDKNSENISSRQLKIIFVGAISHEQKGVLYIPEIIQRVLSQRKDVHCTIIGDGIDLPRLKEQCKNFIAAGKMEFCGNISPEEVQKQFQAAHVLLLPSHFEGMPLVLLEAMSLGVVPVASLLKGCTDAVIADSQDGFLIPVGNTDAFAKTILALVDDRQLLQAMSYAAEEKIRTQFSYQLTGDRYLSLIEKCRIEKNIHRAKSIDYSMAGDFPNLPLMLVRPIRKIFRIIHSFKK